jgi:hypothetical protein
MAKVESARMSYTLGMLLSNGVPLLSSLAIVKETLSNAAMIHAFDHLQERVKEGKSLAAPLADTGLFPSLATQIPTHARRADTGEWTRTRKAVLTLLPLLSRQEYAAAYPARRIALSQEAHLDPVVRSCLDPGLVDVAPTRPAVRQMRPPAATEQNPRNEALVPKEGIPPPRQPLQRVERSRTPTALA